MIMVLYWSTITRAGSDGCNASGGCRCWVKARSQIFLNQLNLNMKMESSKEKLSHPLTQEAGLHLTA